MSAEQSAVSRCNENTVAVLDMTGAWRAVIARASNTYRVWYHHTGDDQRLKTMQCRLAMGWLARQ